MATQKTYITSFNLFFLFFSIVWNPLQTFYLHIDGEGRTMVFLAVLAVLFNIGKTENLKSTLRSPAFICWIVLVLYTFINSMVKGYRSDYGFFSYVRINFLEPFIFLWIAIIELSRDKSKCLKVLLAGLLVYMVLGALNTTLFDDNRSYAEGLGNSLPLYGMSAVFVAGLLLNHKNLKGGWWSFIGIIIFALYLIVITATRKALGGLLLIFVGVLIGQNKRFNARNIIVSTIVVVSMVIGFKWVRENTFMGERLNAVGEQFDYELSTNPVVNDFLLDFLGDRSFFYYYGMKYFHQQPLTGIGLENFAVVHQSQMRIHSEYIVQLCENGIVGFALLLLFYILLLTGLNRQRKKGENIWVYLFGLLAVLFINFTAWTYNMDYIMLIYAILIAQIYSTPPPSLNQI